MQSMTEEARRVIGGVDAHADTHHAAALDERGALLGTRSFTVSARGYQELLAWLGSFGEVESIGVESTGSCAAGLTRYLVGEGIAVIEVNQPHPHTRRRRGKTDAIDAELAARNVLTCQGAVIPKQTTGIVESIRQLRVARESAVKSRSAATLQLGDLILTAPSGLNAAKLALRSLSRRIALLDEEIAELDARLAPLVASAAPRTTALLGISTGHAGQLLLTAGQNIERLRSEAAFAALCGVSPIPVASGKRGGHRLNYGGDRQANRALHMIAVCRLRYCPKTRAYVERRTGEGKTKKEIIRCLKRYIALEVHASLRDDLGSLSLTP